MKLIHRLAYYGLGLFFGIVILLFFLGGKKTSCDYSPNARVLKNIRIKKRSFSPAALQSFSVNSIDTSVVSEVLQNGDVDFDRSQTNRQPCNLYFISGGKTKTIELEIENCDSLAIIKDFKIKKGE